MTRRWSVLLFAGAFAGALGAIAACSAFSSTENGDETADASVDASSDAFSDPSFCENHDGAALCSDFDLDAARPFGGWTRAVEVGTGTLGVDTSTFRSAPQSLIARTAPNDGGFAEARLELVLPKTATRTRVSFDFRASEPQLPTDGTMSIGELVCVPGGAWLFLRKNAGAIQLGLFADDLAPSAFHEIFFMRSEWMRLEIDATWAPEPHVTVRSNGTSVVDIPFPRDCRKEAEFAFVMGTNGRLAPGTSWEARYDNALVEIDPP